MNPGDSCVGEIAMSETPRPRRFLGALLGRVYQLATHRAATLMQLTYNALVKQDPP